MVQSFSFPGGPFPMAFPEAADVEKMFERIENCTNPLAEKVGQAVGVVDGAHVQKRIELFATEIRNVIKAEMQRQTREAMLLFKLVRVQNLPLELEQERITLQSFIEQKGKIVIRVRGHLAST